MNIANQGFPATRADLNNALQALASNNSGTSAPSTTFANQWWYDTTNNKLYIRNEANNAWIQVAVLDQTNAEWQIITGVIQAKDGDGLAFKTDDGTTRFDINDSTGKSTFRDDVGIEGTTPTLQMADTSVSNNVMDASYDEFLTLDIDPNNVRGNSGLIIKGDGTERMRIDSDGDLNIVNTGQASLNYTTDGSTDYAKITGGKSGSGVGDLRFSTYSGGIAERMRIDSSGRVLVGTNTVHSGTNGTLYIETNAVSSRNLMVLNNSDSGSSSAGIIAIYRNQNFTGGITNTNTSTSFNESSDYRLKENVTDVTDGITRVKQLAPKRFNFIADADTTVDGFLAHEAATVVPESVSGAKDAVQVWAEGEELPDGVSVGDNKLDADGNTIPVYQGIDKSKLVPLLTAALQEAIAKIEALETRVATLEG